MAIRSAAKAIILRDNKVLVNRCKAYGTGEVYYDLPGGGQNQFETMEEAVIREVLEETGHHVEIVRFVALAEEIYLDKKLRNEYFDYTHRVLHIFLVKLVGSKQQEPSEIDFQQEESVWLNLKDANHMPFHPKSLTGNLVKLVNGPYPVYLGNEYILRYNLSILIALGSTRQ